MTSLSKSNRWSIGALVNAAFKCGLVLRIPRPLLPLAGQLSQRPDNVAVYIDETPVEVGEAQERSHIEQLARDLPVPDRLNLLRIHLDPFSAGGRSKVFHLRLEELALLRFEV